MNDSQKNTTAPQTDLPETPAAEKPKKKRKIHRKWRYGTASTVLIVAVIAAVVLLNVVANLFENRWPLSLDLTADDTFTLSDDCREVAAGVKQEVEVVIFQNESYFSSPSFGSEQLNTVIRQFHEALNQCVTASGGNIRTRYINYADNPTLVSQYADYDVSESSILFLSDGRYSTVTTDDLFSYDQESYYYYGSLTITESLVEQVIAANLRKVTGELSPVVMMVGHSENTYALNNLKTTLEANAYEVIECDLTQSDTIERNAITMVIPAPTVDYSNDEIVQIRTWLQQNGEYSRNLVLLTDYTADCPNLYEFVNEEYGIEVSRELICETKSYLQTPYAAYGDIATDDLIDGVSGKVLSQYTQRLILNKDNDSERTIYNVPLVTFGSTAQLVSLDAVESDSVTPYDADSYPVVGAAYAHKQVPSPTANMQVHSYVAVFGSPYFLDQALSYVSSAKNASLFTALFNEISGAENAALVEARTMTAVTLDYEASTAKVVGIWIFTLAVPILTLGIGLALYLRRRHL